MKGIFIMEFLDALKKKISDTQDIIYSFLPKEEGFQKNIIEAMNYALKAGGKRLRPLLISEFYYLFNKDDSNKDALSHFMAAIEFIHTYSLVHDDLPAMDNDDYRRGIKTTHIVYGYAAAILAGDGLLNYAYETAAESFNEKNDIEDVAKAIKVLSKKPGVYGMLGGQSVDVENDKILVDADTLNFIYDLKTGALIECSMMIGAILAKGNSSQVECVEKIASNVGRAFQIQDDILDVTSTTDELGKPVNSDEKNNKTTYVTLYGVEGASKMVRDYSNEAIRLLDSLTDVNEDVRQFIRELIIYLVDRRK